MALQLLARRVLQLSFSFSEIHYVIELPGGLPAAAPQQAQQQAAAEAAAVAALLRESLALHRVARAAGVQVQVYPSESPAATQVREPAGCC